MKPYIRNFIKVANEQTAGQGITDTATSYARENKERPSGLLSFETTQLIQSMYSVN